MYKLDIIEIHMNAVLGTHCRLERLGKDVFKSHKKWFAAMPIPKPIVTMFLLVLSTVDSK